ncbi:MAG: hypothetical protein HY303_05260 [Candidatus Wallbacteria bacterium]|nr:hypothetical protein [Candidatus Wallbacteria bacterium]
MRVRANLGRAGSSRLLAVAVLTLVLSSASATPAQAGILDTIKGFFGKASDTVKGFFSGGGEQDFVKLMQQAATSQQGVSDKQTNLQALLNGRGTANVKPNDPMINERLNDLAQASRQNEALYLSLLKARDELVKGKKDISKYQDTLSQITEKQNAIEQQYQEIQSFSRKIGAFTPPATIASAGGSKATAMGGMGEVDFNDPSVQGYIDEWLKGVQLTQWGQYIAPGAVAAGPPDHGAMGRHEWIWKNMWTKSADSNITLGDFVRQRLAGRSPQIELSRHVASAGPATVNAVQTSQSTPVPVAQPAASQVESASAVSAVSPDQPSGELRDVVDQEKSVLNSIAKLNTDGQGNSEAARKLYESLKAIQTRKNQLMSTAVAAPAASNTGGSSGSITTPR